MCDDDQDDDDFDHHDNDHHHHHHHHHYDHDKLWPLGSQGELPAPPGSTNTGDTLAEARGPFGNYRGL